LTPNIRIHAVAILIGGIGLTWLVQVVHHRTQRALVATVRAGNREPAA